MSERFFVIKIGEDKMKLSRFNVLKKINDDNVFFNSKTCALAVVDDKFMEVYEDVKNGQYQESKYDSKLLNDMKMSGCLIEDDVDELTEFQFYRNSQKYGTQALALTIAPTLDCNFRCQYCFENHRHGLMRKDTQVALINFIQNRIKYIHKLSINWYGGEPLLAKTIIYGLSQKILAMCEAHNVEYDAFIITNASLLQDTDVEEFKKYKISGAQITIDGPKEIHDKRRHSCDGKSTFDLLITNVNKLVSNGINVIIRINIDKENIEEIDALLQILNARICNKEKIRFDFGKTTAFTDVCKSIESECFDNNEYAEMLLPLYGKVMSYGFSMNKMAIYPMARYNYCCSDYANSFVIDPFGSIHKCWNHVGEDDEKCGILDLSGERFTAKYYQWINWNPLKYDKCRNCNLLPICVGGCPDAARKNPGNEPICDAIKYNLDKVLQYYYRMLKGV